MGKNNIRHMIRRIERSKMTGKNEDCITVNKVRREGNRSHKRRKEGYSRKKQQVRARDREVSKQVNSEVKRLRGEEIVILLL